MLHLQLSDLRVEFPVLGNQALVVMPKQSQPGIQDDLRLQRWHLQARFAQAVLGSRSKPIPHLLLVGVEVPTWQLLSRARAATTLAKTAYRHVQPELGGRGGLVATPCKPSDPCI